MRKNSKQRLSQQEFVMNVFGFFSEDYENSPGKSIWDISLDVEDIISRLKDKYDVTYSSELWVWTQLNRYEQELGINLFRKIKRGKKSFAIVLSHPYINFFQKKHLFINEKIKVSNGIYDMIVNYANNRHINAPLKIFLGAGTLCYHLSTIIAGSGFLSERKIIIYTNNLGALTQLISPGKHNANLDIKVPDGSIDQTTYTITGRNESFSESEFDFIIQGTSCICEEKLFIESVEERIRKGAILKKTSGIKVLALTKKEFMPEPIENSEAYGQISDYDFIVVPKRSAATELKKSYEESFDSLRASLTPEIISWNYEIFKII